MSDLGQQLKEARLSMGLSLDDVQEITKIRKRYLEAIEAGDYKVLPGSFYVRAFIKTYAEAVGINADELLAEHKQNVPEAVPDTTMEPVLQKRRSRQTTERNSKWLTTALMWSFFALIVIVIYLYFTVWSQSNEAKTKEPDPTAITNNSENPQNNTKPNSNTGTDQDGATNTNAGTDDQTGTPGDGNATDTNTTGPDDTNTDNTANKEVVVAPDGKEGSTTKFKVQPVGSEPVKIVITAKGSSWVEVRKGDKRGEKLYYQTMQDGEVLNFDLGEEGMFIKSGASPNTTITVGGQVVDDGKNTSKIQLNLGTVDTSSDSNSANTGTNSSNASTDGTVTGQ
ncbi:helix-turn-helix domain-containing protein [Paenibacillus sp. GM2]|uniref:RodZ domain-containing protein n=1 Tax=Paenibacillus sp. GM2 TaxID=1622070 RepID=UPI000837BB95